MKDKIDAYWELGPEDRRVVEAYVADHPELMPRLARARALASLIDEASSAPPADEDLARYVARGMFGGNSELSQSELKRLEEELESDPDVVSRAAEMERRLQDLARQHDPLAHFASLERESDEASRPPVLRRVSPTSGKPTGTRAVLRSLPYRRWATAAVMAFLVLAASFVVLELATTPRLERIARFQQDELDPAPYELRTRSGNDVQVSPTDSLFIQALSILREGQRSYFGLFQSRDDEALARAASVLRQMLESEERETYLTLEARYLLAKILIQQGRLGSASEQLETVIDEGGGRTARARELRAELETQP